MVIEGNNQFTFAFMQHINRQYHLGNLFCSPYSIASGLARLAIGAKGNTLNEIQQTLKYSSSFIPLIGSLDHFFLSFPKGKNGTQVVLANAIWLSKDSGIIPAYQYAYKRDFFSDIQLINFQGSFVSILKDINEWTSNSTNRHISQIVGSQDLSEDTHLILTTTFYLKGIWQNIFSIRKTERKPFYISSNRTKQVEMMYTSGQYPLFTTEKLTLIEIPYLSEEGSTPQYSLVILLPKELMGWQTVLAEFVNKNWKEWNKKLTPQMIKLGLPRFRVEQRLVLDSILKGMGIKEIFNDKADLAGISSEHLHLNRFLHKALIQIEEEGSQSRISGLNGKESTEEATEQEWLVDHPFFFLIIERSTQSILSIGRILQP
jgi:serine protease inhibitor